MIKAVIFDLDGVLIDAKEIHFNALNEALVYEGIEPISKEKHLTQFDGLKTKAKLKKLKISKLKAEKIYNLKQEITQSMLENNLTPNWEIIKLLAWLNYKGYYIIVASNSISQTIENSLKLLKIDNLVDSYYSNETVTLCKPHPEIYWEIFKDYELYPNEALIIEDSPIGLKAAYSSGANVLRITKPSQLNKSLIKQKLNELNDKTPLPSIQWEDKEMNVLIPMAGKGSRFKEVGYTFPKPLIEVNQKPMIQIVIENLNIKANYIYVVQKEHREKYNLDTLLNLLTPGCTIVETDKVTKGAACTALLAKDYINNDKPLFFANSDQFVEWDSNEFFYKMQETQADGGIVTFKATHPKWSFAKISEGGRVIEVAEKNPISDNATVGFYYWKKGGDFVYFAEQMIEKNIKTNGEFYVCPVFNEAIDQGLNILPYEIDNMYGLGTPEDLEFFVNNYNKI